MRSLLKNTALQSLKTEHQQLAQGLALQIDKQKSEIASKSEELQRVKLDYHQQLLTQNAELEKKKGELENKSKEVFQLSTNLQTSKEAREKLQKEFENQTKTLTAKIEDLQKGNNTSSSFSIL